MRCANCGADIPDDLMICPDCCTEVQIVPDYNPLEDMLAREVRGSVEDVTRPISSNDLRRYRRDENQRYGSSTRVISHGDMEDIRSRSQYGYQDSYGRYSGQTQYRGQRTTGNVRRNTTSIYGERADRRGRTPGREDPEVLRRKEAEEKRRQQQLRKKKKRQQQIRNISIMLFFIAILVGACSFIIYRNSYNGLVKRGYESIQLEEYSAAERYFNTAVSKNEKRAEAYTGLAEVYIAQNEQKKAENIFLNVIESQPENAELYKAAIEFYMQTDQLSKISSLLDGCSQMVLSELDGYVSYAPEFSLKEGKYNEVQELSLTGDGKIYYTDDGTKPTEKSKLYENPILISEGTTIISAICVNEQGIPSLSESKTYTVDIPIADAPYVSPSTGQYSTSTQIIIEVPEGYTAYYTLDGSTPTAASTLYTGPIDMPVGQTTFSAVLLSKTSGKLTQVTTRSYLLEY